ncbi:hypothetical protein EMIHUDRAFT_119187 [Emiliania huxleyi CCMP1516]|uniref:Fe2OG dioxygenase domain-containing protein n=2 Tax=Emiliania huxleyi TaxID=2903 RepID=A0A0D3IXA1_EMIH1|nr:hypothetical protein EMIHUDRAFT_119187 [Emiliania huxleyi CCMP1516]EOD15886.1 hypothetical protein EMIHUDRAFT_119187 [Emiliania huxleyi CCMP1516]|eukprot:XP_005768315.1 hypothetical protein EMIHUDRAFT_119187 [Emiliania huxleyi CCMP1516]
MPPTRPRRVGRAHDASYVLFEGLLGERQLRNARAFAASDAVQAQLSEGILFDEKTAANGYASEEEENEAQNEGGTSAAPPAKKQKRNVAERRSRIAWLEREAAEGEASPVIPPWLHAQLRSAARTAHRLLGDKLCPIGVDALGRWTPRYEPVQYTEYGPGERLSRGVGSHYASWHTDSELDSDDVEDTRGVTVVVLLSDGAAFGGGKFQTRARGGAPQDRAPQTIELKAGDAIGFPAARLEHRVTKVTRGLRQSLVFWANRPA